MSFLNSFLHGDALTEILLEGHNPYALRKLDTADLDAIRQQTFTSEQLRAYVSGRIVGGGRGIWVLAGQAVLLRDARKRDVERVALADIDHFEAERGRFGHSVRLRCEDRSWSLFGVDRDLARAMFDALKASGVACEFDERHTRNHVWRAPGPAGWALDCIEDARRRLSPA